MCSGALRSRSRCGPRSSRLTPSGSCGRDQVRGDPTAQHLPAVGDSDDPRGPIYSGPEVVPFPHVGFAGMKSHPDNDRFRGRPGFSAKLFLRFLSCGNRATGTREDGRDPVPHGREHRSPVPGDDRLENHIMLGHRGTHRAVSSSCQNLVEPWMSVNRKVTVPEEAPTKEFSLREHPFTTAVVEGPPWAPQRERSEHSWCRPEKREVSPDRCSFETVGTAVGTMRARDCRSKKWRLTSTSGA